MISALPPRAPRQIEPPKPQVLTADPDIIKYDVETLPVDIIADLLLQEISSTEFIILSRNGRVAGKTVDKSIVSNLDQLANQYGPKVLGSVQSDVRGAKFGIPLSHFIDPDTAEVSLDGDDIVITLDNIPFGMDVEIVVETAPDIKEWEEV